MKHLRYVFLILFLVIVVIFGIRQGLHKLAFGPFMAEFQKQKEIQTLKPQLGDSNTANNRVDKEKSPSFKRPSNYYETHGNQSPILLDNKGTVIINGSTPSPPGNEEKK